MTLMASTPVDMLWLGEPACGDPAVTGGKAASLGRLAGEYRVPPGFCLPSSAYLRWAGSALDGEHDPPPDLVAGLARAYGDLAERCGTAAPAVAVRSSATDEDGTGASFAGQYETILNVAGVGAVVQAVVRCWSAARSARVTAYRRRQGASDGQAALAVLVQQMVMADASAVAFSAHPVTGDRDEIVIDASWGLGESIVGGSVTPDSFVLSRVDGAIARRSLSAKRRMTVPSDGGTLEVEVPCHLQNRPALDDRQVLEVARLAVSLEMSTGRPVDVECAYQDGVLYLLQCRPITTVR